MLRLENVQKRYGDFQLNCSMEVKPGYVTGLIGANGAGKSTTFRSILNLITPDGGKVYVNGIEKKELSIMDKENMGVVLAESTFSGSLTVKQIIPVLAAMYPSFGKEQFMSNCKCFSLPLDKKIKDMSTGMRAKLKVLVATSHEAKLLILDEPTAGLDVLARDQILNLLRTYMEVEGRSILISSHISSDLENFCDDIYMIHDGKIIFHEDTDVLLSEYAVLKVDEKQFDRLDQRYLLYKQKTAYGYDCFTKESQFYQDNYPGIAIEKGSIDRMIEMLEKGVRV